MRYSKFNIHFNKFYSYETFKKCKWYCINLQECD